MRLLKGAHLYAPEDKGVCDLLIGNGKILAMNRAIDISSVERIFPDTEVVDVGGRTVIPGLVDPHVHIIGGGGEDGFRSRMPELSYKECIRAGVTTLVGVLGTDSRTRTVGNLIAKARGLTEEGVTAYCLTGSYEYPAVSLMGDAADDVVYIPEVLGVKLAISDHRCSNPTERDLITLASKVRIASLIGKKPGVVHMHTGVGKNGLKIVADAIRDSDIPAGHFMPTHIRPETPYVEEYLKLGGSIDLTSGNDPGKTAGYLKHFQVMTEPERITVSSDANGTLPVWNEKKEIVGFTAARLSLLDFLRILVKKEGMSISEALPYVTVHAARRLKLYPAKGALAVGSDADLLVLNDAFELLDVMTRGEYRMKGGEIK